MVLEVMIIPADVVCSVCLICHCQTIAVSKSAVRVMLRLCLLAEEPIVICRTARVDTCVSIVNSQSFFLSTVLSFDSLGSNVGNRSAFMSALFCPVLKNPPACTAECLSTSFTWSSRSPSWCHSSWHCLLYTSDAADE